MARGIVYVVFLLPVVVSVIFGFVVMVQILEDPGRELNMLPFLDPSYGEGHGAIEKIRAAAAGPFLDR